MAAPVRRWTGLRRWYLPEEMKRIYLRCSLSVLIICMALVNQSQTRSQNCLDGEAVNVLDVDIACTKHEEKCTAEKECTNDGGTFVQSEIIGSETMLQKLQNETYLWIWLEEKRYWVNKTKIDNLRQMFPEPILSTFWSTYIENKALFVCRLNGTLNGTEPAGPELATAVPTTVLGEEANTTAGLEDRRSGEDGSEDKHEAPRNRGGEVEDVVQDKRGQDKKGQDKDGGQDEDKVQDKEGGPVKDLNHDIDALLRGRMMDAGLYTDTDEHAGTGLHIGRQVEDTTEEYTTLDYDTTEKPDVTTEATFDVPIEYIAIAAAIGFVIIVATVIACVYQRCCKEPQVTAMPMPMPSPMMPMQVPMQMPMQMSMQPMPMEEPYSRGSFAGYSSSRYSQSGYSSSPYGY